MLRRRVKVFAPMHDSSIRSPPSRISQLSSLSVVSAKKENAKKAWAQKVKETWVQEVKERGQTVKEAMEKALMHPQLLKRKSFPWRRRVKVFSTA
jgi:hypothetical protein